MSTLSAAEQLAFRLVLTQNIARHSKLPCWLEPPQAGRGRGLYLPLIEACNVKRSCPSDSPVGNWGAGGIPVAKECNHLRQLTIRGGCAIAGDK